jgi:hypothetical protein
MTSETHADAEIFEHKGGHILGADGEIRYFEADPAGFYFWLDGPDGLRRLFGPYDTREDADMHLEAAV